MRQTIHRFLCLAVAVPAFAALGSHPGHTERATHWTPVRTAAPTNWQERARDLRQKHLARQRSLPEFLHDKSRQHRILSQGIRTADIARALPQARLTQSALTRTARSKAGASQLAAVDSVCRVLLVRVGFETNRAPGLTSMAADGDFMMQPDSTVNVDPPPHDVSYFEAHLLALQSFYTNMSAGAFRIEGSVFPPAGQPSIKLTDVADYGPGAGGFWTLEPLERYFRDAVALLDQEATSIDLADYDSYIIVHPGSDLQNDINLDSPNDIPTFFITLGDSVAVEGGNHEIRNGLVLPETISQDNSEGSILGALCHEFGHQLGLPDWYDVFTGLPVVGEWSLMDSGNAAFFAFQTSAEADPVFAFGLLPTSLSTYDRLLLGFEIPYIVQAPEDQVSLRPWASALASPDPTSALLPVSLEEFFLVENRRDYLAPRNELGEVEICPYLNRDADTGVILWMSKDDTGKPPRQRRNSGEYDFFIASLTAPEAALGQCGEIGFGLLVWHIDERVLVDGLFDNTANTDEDYRAFRLVEASGEVEIGNIRLVAPFSFVGDGWNDPFRRDAFVDYTKMLDDTVPNNWNSDWARSGWGITDVDVGAGESRLLRVRVTDGVPGWPIIFSNGVGEILRLEPRSFLVADVENAGRLLVGADSRGLHGFDALGAVTLQNSAGLVPETLAYTPAWMASDGLGTVAGLDSAGVLCWNASLGPGGLTTKAGFPMPLPGGAGKHLSLLPEIGLGVAETQGGDWVVFDSAGQALQHLPGVPGESEAAVVAGNFQSSSAAVALVHPTRVFFEEIGTPKTAPVSRRILEEVPLDLDPSEPSDLMTTGGHFDPSRSTAQVIVVHRDGRLRVIDPVDGLLRGFDDLPADDYFSIALADVNGDDVLELFAASRTHIVGVTGRGAVVFNTPITVRDLFAIRSPQSVVSQLVVADVAGDELPEILFSTDLGLVYAVDATGRVLDGFPRKMLPDDIGGIVIAADLDTDPMTRELIACSEVTATVLARTGGEVGHSGWTVAAGNMHRSRFGTTAGPLASGDRVQSLERPFMAYPNPAAQSDIRLRIHAKTQGPYQIRIFNLEGEKVWERRGTAEMGTQEVVWNTSGLASGTYLCRFVSDAAGVSAPLIEPITLVR